MNDIASAADILAELREASGMTQRELAARAHVAQPVIARLERPGSNPTVRTLAAVAAAAGYRLRVVVEPFPKPDPVVERYKHDVDRTLLRENLKRTVDERIRTLGEWQEATAALREATRRAKAAR